MIFVQSSHAWHFSVKFIAMKPLLRIGFHYVVILELNVSQIFLWRVLSYSSKVLETNTSWLIYLWRSATKRLRMVVFLGAKALESRQSYPITTLIYTPFWLRLQQLSRSTWVLTYIEKMNSAILLKNQLSHIAAVRVFFTMFLIGAFSLNVLGTADKNLV